MKYLNVKAVKEKVKAGNKQISKEALHAIDVKIDLLLGKAIRQFNGHHKRIDQSIINLFKL